MAIQFDAIGTLLTVTAPTVTLHHMVGASTGRVLFVSVHILNNTPGLVTGITANGAALTQLDTQAAAGSLLLELWYLLNPSAGDNEIVISFSSSGQEGIIQASSYYGLNSVNASSAFGTVAKATGTASPVTVNASAAVGQVVVDFFGIRWGTNPKSTVTVGAGQTERANVSGGSYAFSKRTGGSSDEDGAASVTMSWTASGALTDWCTIAVPLKVGSGKSARVRYEENAFISEAAGGLEILEDTGMAVHPERLAVDNWLRADGPYFPTPRRYANLIEDPSMMYIEAVRVDPRGRISVQTAKETMLETLLRRLGGGA